MTTKASADGWIEIGPKKTAIPEGYVGNLTAEQQEKLFQMWGSFFDICERATGTAVRAEGDATDFSGDAAATKQDQKNADKASDEAKAKAKQAAEEAGMQELLKKYGSEALRDTYWAFCKGDHPDTNMCRFLRARKWDVAKATAMMAACLKWRLDTNVERLTLQGDLGNGKEIPKYLQQQSGKVFAMGCNRNEQPVCYVNMRFHSTLGQPLQTMKKFIISQMETWRTLFVPPNDKIVIVFDCSALGLRNLDVPSLLYVLACLESYFPESLAAIYMYNGPWILGKTWNAIKGLIDPVVRSKVHFTNSVDELAADIPREQLLEFVGGEVSTYFNWVDPKEGENDRVIKEGEERERRWKLHRELTKQFEETTVQWCKSRGKDPKAAERRRVLAKRLRVSSLELEPWTRGLTAYHRSDNLCASNPGIIVWYYELKDGRKVRQVVGQRHCLKSLRRELAEVDSGSSVDEAEAKTQRMLDDGSWGRWDTLEYGSGGGDAADGAQAVTEKMAELKTETVDAAAPAAAAVA